MLRQDPSFESACSIRSRRADKFVGALALDVEVLLRCVGERVDVQARESWPATGSGWTRRPHRGDAVGASSGGRVLAHARTIGSDPVWTI